MKKQLILFLLILAGFSSVFAKSYPEMINVEGGSFEMGDELGIGFANEQPVHTVTLKSFSIAKTEATVLQWKTYCTVTGRQMPKTPSQGWIDSHPIVNVSWDDAVGYCGWLSDKTGKMYSLPTEAQWEYAARGGSQSKGFEYSGGESMDMVGWFEPNSNKQTQPVAQKRANELGLYDMSGNIWEWCQDWYGAYDAAAQTGPRDAKLGGNNRMLRGGGWNSAATRCRVARRDFEPPGYRYNYDGFRVVAPQ